MDRLGSRSSWAGQGANQPLPVLRPPSALAIASASIAGAKNVAEYPGTVVRRDRQGDHRRAQQSHVILHGLLFGTLPLGRASPSHRSSHTSFLCSYLLCSSPSFAALR